MLLQGTFHDLGLAADSPDSDFTLITTRNDFLAVASASQSSDSVVVSIVDGVEEFSRLRQESSDLAIIPSRKNRLSIMSKEDAEAFKSGNLNSQKFLSGLGIPDTNVIQRAGGKQLRVTVRECDIVDSLVVAGISKLGSDVIGVAPVDCGLVGTAEEVGRIGSETQRGNCTHDFSRFLDVEVNGIDLGDLSITSTDKEVAVGEELDALDTLREQFLVGSKSLEKIVLEIDLHDISGLGSDVSEFVSGVDDTAGKNTLDLVSEDFGVFDLLLDEVEIPNAETKGVDGQAFGGGVVEEANFVCNIHANWISNECFAAFNLNNLINLMFDSLLFIKSAEHAKLQV